MAASGYARAMVLQPRHPVVLAFVATLALGAGGCDGESAEPGQPGGSTATGGSGGDGAAGSGGTAAGGSGGSPSGSFVGEPGFAATGSFGDGEIITVTGEGFGTKTQAAPIFFDTVDNPLINGVRSDRYDGLPSGTEVPTDDGDPWFRGNIGPVTLRDDADTYGNRSKTYLTEFLADGHIDGWMEAPSGFPDPVLGEVTEVYIRWYVNPSFDPHESPGSHKFIRIWDTSGGAEVGIRISWTQMHLTYDQIGTGSTPSWADWGGTPDSWNLMEIYVDTATGVIRAWTNNAPVHDVSDFAPGANNELDPGVYQGIHPRLWGLDGSGDPVPDWLGQTMRMTDYWADSTPQRFEIADTAELSSASVREPQPAEAWTDGSVTLRLNYGALESLAGKFLFHVDETNTPTLVGHFQ